MLEKNKDYLEIRVSSTDYAFTKNASTTISIEGFSYDTSFRLPDHGESYVIVSKEKFDQLQTNVKHYMDLSTRAQYWKDKCEQLQADNQHYRELANQWEENYNLLLKKTGFDTVESLISYLTNISKCDTLREAIASLAYSVKFARDERRDLSKKLDECEKDYISERDKAEALQTENEQLRNERTHIVYLNDPLGIIAKWEKVTGYDRPEDFLKWKANIEGIMEGWKDGTGCKYPAEARVLLEKWKTLTKCEKPEAAATWITSYESACERGNRLAEMVEKLKEEVDSWKNVTGYSTPEDYMHARLNNTTPFDYTSAWQKATGCDTPEAAKKRISGLISEAEAWESDYNHLLALTGFDNEGEIEDFLEQNNNRNKLTTVIDNLKLENETMKTALRASNLAMQKELENNIDEWKKFTESNWQGITGFSTPEKCSSYIDRLEKKLEDIKNLTEED